MAARSSIRMKQQDAMTRIEAATGVLFERAFEFSTQGKDPELLHAQQLEALAEFLEAQALARPQMAGSKRLDEAIQVNVAKAAPRKQKE